MADIVTSIQAMRETMGDILQASGNRGARDKGTGDAGTASTNHEEPLVEQSQELMRTGASPEVVEQIPGDNGRCDVRYQKLELPVFIDEDPSNWLFRAERYFFVNGVYDDEKLQATAVCLEGPVLTWFKWREVRQPLSSW